MGKRGVRVGQVCAFCWGSFVTRPHATREYCCQSCGALANGHRLLRCANCGEDFSPKRTDSTTCCSRACGFEYQRTIAHAKKAHRLWERVLQGDVGSRVCPVCFRRHMGRGKTCGDACSTMFNRMGVRRQAEMKPAWRQPYTCAECGTEHAPAYADKKTRFCSRACMRRYSKRINKERYGRNHRQRARRAGVAYEPVNVKRVYERDGWMCGICGGKIAKDKKAPHPRSPSIDHIIPLSLGGPHTYDNVQAAHFGCNSMKGNSSGCAQLRVFGRVA